MAKPDTGAEGEEAEGDRAPEGPTAKGGTAQIFKNLALPYKAA